MAFDPSQVCPTFTPRSSSSNDKTTIQEEPHAIQTLIDTLKLCPHVEGGYFVETDRDARRVPNPFINNTSQTPTHDHKKPNDDNTTRSASTSIHYLITPKSPLGAFHRNRGRTVHTLHSGRARYVVVHADEVAAEAFPGGYAAADADDASSSSSRAGEADAEGSRWTGKARIEVFTVGHDLAAGERLQWIVEGGKYKASFLLPDVGNGHGSKGGCLISETVVPGFEYKDHDFLTRARFNAIVPQEYKGSLEWMLRKTE